MKRNILLMLCALSVFSFLFFVSCGDGNQATSETNPYLTTVVDTAEPLPDVDYAKEESCVTDYAFGYGCFVKSSYNGAGNPLLRVYLNPVTLEKTPLSFFYAYGANGILSAFSLGEKEESVAFSLTYNSQGLPAYAEATVSGATYRVVFTCDSKGRILSEQFDFIRFDYAANGRISKESGSSFAGSYEIVNESVDGVIAVAIKAMGEEILDFVITYDEKGNPLSMTAVINGQEPWQYAKGLSSWQYDGEGRLSFVSVKAEKDHTEIAYAYGEDGSVVSKTVSVYNQAGALIGKTVYDKNGNPIS